MEQLLTPEELRGLNSSDIRYTGDTYPEVLKYTTTLKKTMSKNMFFLPSDLVNRNWDFLKSVFLTHSQSACFCILVVIGVSEALSAW